MDMNSKEATRAYQNACEREAELEEIRFQLREKAAELCNLLRDGYALMGIDLPINMNVLISQDKEGYSVRLNDD